MEIKPKYDEFRIGAMFIEPVKATEEDLLDFVMATRTGGSMKKVYQFMLDCRALAGKIFNDERVKDLVRRTESDFLLKTRVVHPKVEETIVFGGNESRTIVMYTNRKIEPYLKKIEEWIKKFFHGVSPVAHLLNYGRRNKYGLAEKDGVLTYVMVNVGSYGSESYIFGQPYTEASWGYDD